MFHSIAEVYIIVYEFMIYSIIPSSQRKFIERNNFFTHIQLCVLVFHNQIIVGNN